MNYARGAMLGVMLSCGTMFTACPEPLPQGGGAGGGSGLLTGAGGASGGGAHAGGGGGTQDSTLTFSGTLTAPAGGDVTGTHLIACVVVSGQCDNQLSLVLSLTNSGSSVPFTMTVPAGYTYALIAWKDLNSSNSIDAGDYLAYLTDTDGSTLGLTSSAAGLAITMSVKDAPVTTTVPAGLVGVWKFASSATDLYSSKYYTINADGSYLYEFEMVWNGNCLITSKIVETSGGSVSVQGNTITFTPLTGKNTTYNCYNGYTEKLVVNPTSYTYSLSGATLMLDNGTVTNTYTKL